MVAAGTTSTATGDEAGVNVPHASAGVSSPGEGVGKEPADITVHKVAAGTGGAGRTIIPG